MPFEPYEARGSRRTVGKCSVGHYNSHRVEQTLISISSNLMKKLIGKPQGRVDLDVDKKTYRIAIQMGDSLAANIPSSSAKRTVITLGKLGYLLKPHEAVNAKIEYIEKCAEIEGKPNVLMVTIPTELRKGPRKAKPAKKAKGKVVVSPILAKPATQLNSHKTVITPSKSKSFEARTTH